MSNQPLVSIIIPVYNGSDFVREAIDSALAQTYTNTEIIVVNDGSNDGGATRNIALEYGDKIFYIEKENGGVSSALNRGIREMHGKYFSWLSHDDMYTRDKISNQIALLEKYNFDENVVALGATQFINAQSEYIHTNHNKRFDEDRLITWQEALYNVITKTAFNGCSLMIPKHVFETVGFFNESLRYVQDIEMWERMLANKFSIAYTSSRDSLSRIHGKQLTQTGRALFKKESEEEYDNIRELISSVSNDEYNFIYAIALRSAVYNLGNVARKCKKDAKNSHPFTLKQKTELTYMLIYGKIRPLIRKMYYRLFRKVKTQ